LTERHDDRTDLGNLPVSFEQLQTFRQDRCDLGAFADTNVEQGVGGAIHTTIKLMVAKPIIFKNYRSVVRAKPGMSGDERFGE
jgi:hypothetical protein